jgi:hypothetical protein
MSLNCSYICRSNRSGLDVDERVQKQHAHFGEQVAFFREGRLHRFRRVPRQSGMRGCLVHFRSLGRQSIIGKKIDVQRFPGVVRVEQIVNVRDAQLRRETGVDGSALGAFLVELLGGVVRKDDVLRLDAERHAK